MLKNVKEINSDTLPIVITNNKPVRKFCNFSKERNALNINQKCKKHLTAFVAQGWDQKLLSRQWFFE